MAGIRYGLAADGDLPAIRSLLVDCGLLAGGIELIAQNCLVAEVHSRLVGAVALEPYGRSALLRSLAVAPDWRGRSLGRELYTRIISRARLLGLQQLYLLTIDAEKYFTSQGFNVSNGAKRPRGFRRLSNSVIFVLRALFVWCETSPGRLSMLPGNC